MPLQHLILSHFSTLHFLVAWNPRVFLVEYRVASVLTYRRDTFGSQSMQGLIKRTGPNVWCFMSCGVHYSNQLIEFSLQRCFKWFDGFLSVRRRGSAGRDSQIVNDKPNPSTGTLPHLLTRFSSRRLLKNSLAPWETVIRGYFLWAHFSVQTVWNQNKKIFSHISYPIRQLKQWA